MTNDNNRTFPTPEEYDAEVSGEYSPELIGVAKELARELSHRPWEEIPADRPDLRRLIVERKPYDINEHTQDDFCQAVVTIVAYMQGKKLIQIVEANDGE